ncbi:MAG: sulfotransferase [Deltaproteobacteria bacterium]|nr:sulfotransferase [Deltaproteobacteria bacterium]
MNPRYVFVGGLHRSGTSLVARWLGSHPEATSFEETGVWEDEGQHVQDVLLPARLLGGPGLFAHHPAARGARVTASRAEFLRARLLASWEPLWDRSAPVRIAKSPPNLLRGPLLQQLFPGAALVVVRRHPIAVALATRRMSRRLRNLDLVEGIEHWLVAHEWLEKQCSELETFVGLDLAEIIARPAVGDGMFETLGMSPVPPPVPLRDTDAPYREEWRALLRSRGTRDDLMARLSPLEERVSRFGYRLRGFVEDSRPSTPSLWPH